MVVYNTALLSLSGQHLRYLATSGPHYHPAPNGEPHMDATKVKVITSVQPDEADPTGQEHTDATKECDQGISQLSNSHLHIPAGYAGLAGFGHIRFDTHPRQHVMNI
jgi:hypothetical protein